MTAGVQWAAQFAAASELSIRGYDVAFTLGDRTLEADLFVRSPEGYLFSVDVKGLKRRNNWRGIRRVAADSLYVICVVVGELKKHGEKGCNSKSFFIVKHSEIAGKISGRDEEPFVLPTKMDAYLDNWECLPK
jgi:hypothetical protein